jgi:hypothetical protein
LIPNKLFHPNDVSAEQARLGLWADYPIGFQAVDFLKMPHGVVGFRAEVAIEGTDFGIAQLKQALLLQQDPHSAP